MSRTIRRRQILDHARDLAEQRGDVLSRADLRALGADRRFVARQVDAGRWRLHGRQTVAMHTGPLGDDGHRWRAVHEVGASLLDGVTALHVAGLTGITEETIHVSVHHLAQAPQVEGVVVHKVSRRTPGELDLVDPPRTPPALAALRAAQWAASDRQAGLYLVAPVQQRIISGDQLAEARATYLGRRRRAVVETFIADIQDGAHSLGELDFAGMCRRRGLPEPERQVVRTGPKGRIYLDVRWRCGLVVEIDGRQHVEGITAIDDMLRQNSVSLTRDVVLRIPLLGLRLEEDAFLAQVADGIRLLSLRAS